MSTRPQFPIEILSEIEKARSEIFKDTDRFNLLFLPVDTWGRFGSAFTPGTTAPLQQMSATIILQIRAFTDSLFNAEAKHYFKYTSDPKILLAWLNELAGEIRTQVQNQVADSRHDFHCSKQERHDEIENKLKECICYWVDLEEKRSRPKLPSPPHNPVGSRRVVTVPRPPPRNASRTRVTRFPN